MVFQNAIYRAHVYDFSAIGRAIGVAASKVEPLGEKWHQLGDRRVQWFGLPRFSKFPDQA